MTRRPPALCRPDPERCADSPRGEAAVELVAGLALVLLPVTALAATLPTWAEARYAVDAAAVEAARLAARTGETAAAERLAADVVTNHGLEAEPIAEVTVPAGDTDRPAREGEVAARVTAVVPALDLPGLGPVGGWSLTRTHREPLHPWRGRDPDG